jgi:hypothetical protein
VLCGSVVVQECRSSGVAMPHLDFDFHCKFVFNRLIHFHLGDIKVLSNPTLHLRAWPCFSCSRVRVALTTWVIVAM